MLSPVSAIHSTYANMEDRSREDSARGPRPNPAETASQQAFSTRERQIVEQLHARDQEVRAHEQAHLSAAGGIARSGSQFTYVTGPNGKRYAVGGEVSIDIAKVPGDPEATLRKAELIIRAAMAPTQPSTQDHKIASNARAMANQARLELLLQRQQEQNGQRQIPTIDITI